MQIFEYPTGKFLKKIQVQFIEIVAGVAVTANGHLALVDSVHPTVFVLNVNEDNGIMKWFDCASYMEEPSDIIVRGIYSLLKTFKLYIYYIIFLNLFFIFVF